MVLLGRMGDIVACGPVAKELRRSHPSAAILWFCHPDFCDLVAAIPGVTRGVSVSYLEDIKRIEPLLQRNCSVYLNLTLPGTPMSTRGRLWGSDASGVSVNTDNYYNHGPLLHAFTRNHSFELVDEFPELLIPQETRLFVQGMGLPEKYVAVHAESVEGARNWTEEGWRALLEECSSRIPVVLVGKGKAPRFPKNGIIDYRGRLDILSTAEVVRRASLFVGIDSGPAHLANAVRAQALIILGRYRVFDRYCPYTGFFTEGRGATILQFPRECPYAESELILARLRPLLDSVQSGRSSPQHEIVRYEPDTKSNPVPEAGALIKNSMGIRCALDSVEMAEADNSIRLKGWAFDESRDAAPDYLLICRNLPDGTVQVSRTFPFTRLERPDVANHLGKVSALFCGWSAQLTFPDDCDCDVYAWFGIDGQATLLLPNQILSKKTAQISLRAKSTLIRGKFFLRRLFK